MEMLSVEIKLLCADDVPLGARVLKAARMYPRAQKDECHSTKIHCDLIYPQAH